MDDNKAAVAVAKPCDVFTTKDGRMLCGPSLLVPGWGKCGTNALAQYTSQHPRIKWSQKSEILFDPRAVDPADLVAKHNPGVTPDDPYVWAIKNNQEWMDPRELGVELLRAFPSARVVVTTCDPALLPFRWYRHFLLRTMYHGYCRPPRCETNRHQRASLTELQTFVSAKFPSLPTLMDLYERRYYRQSGCRPSGEVRQIFATINASFSVTRPEIFIDPLRGAFSETDGVCGSCVALASMDTYVAKWIASGYVHNESLIVVVMEKWSALGPTYIRSILRMLRLDASEYLWDQVDHFRPVYTIELDSVEDHRQLSMTGLADTHAVRVPDATLRVMATQCHALERVLGYTPPWRACAEQPLAPTHPPFAPLQACIYGRSQVAHGLWCYDIDDPAICEASWEDLDRHPHPCRWSGNRCRGAPCDTNITFPPSPALPPPSPPPPGPPCGPPLRPPYSPPSLPPPVIPLSAVDPATRILILGVSVGIFVLLAASCRIWRWRPSSRASPPRGRTKRPTRRGHGRLETVETCDDAEDVGPVLALDSKSPSAVADA